MKGKYLKAIALCSLVSLGTLGLYGCGTQESKIEIVPTSGTLNEQGQFDAKVNLTYTFKVNLNVEEADTKSVNWASDSLADVQIVNVDELTCEVTFKKEGVYTIAATLSDDESISASLQANVIKGQESYKLEIDDATVKTAYSQGDRFSSEGLVVNRVLYVDGEASSVSTVLTEDDYELSINGAEVEDGDILETAGDFTVDVNASGINGTYTIKVVENEIYPFVKAIRNLANDNYTIGYASGNTIYPERLISNDYVINYTLNEVYYGTSNGVKKYTIQYNEDTEYLTDSGYFYKDVLVPCAEVSEVNELQGYKPASTYSESWLTKDHVGPYSEEGLNGYALDQTLAEYFLNLAGYRFATVNLDVQGGLFLIGNLEDGGEYYQAVAFGVDSTGETQMVPIYFLEIGSSFNEEVEKLVADCDQKTTVDPSLKQAVDSIGGGNFKLRTDPALDSSKVYNYSEVTFTDDYFYTSYFTAKNSDLSDATVDESYGLCNININPDNPEDFNVYSIEQNTNTDGELTFGDEPEPLKHSGGLFEDYKTVAYGDNYSEDYSYTIDPTHWVGFALPGAYDGTELEEYFKNGFYEYWNVEYYEYQLVGEQAVVSSTTYALYGEYAALDFMFSVFGMPYGYIQNGLSAVYHSVTITVDYNAETGEPENIVYSVRLTMPTTGQTAAYKGLPINWDYATLLATGDAARDADVDARITELESTFGVTE